PPAGSPTTATADLRFSFAGGLTCEEAQVNSVQVLVDPAPDGSGGIDPFGRDVACNDGVVDGVLFPIASGTHTFAIVGFRGNQLVYDTTRASSPTLFELGLRSEAFVDAAAAGPSPR